MGMMMRWFLPAAATLSLVGCAHRVAVLVVAEEAEDSSQESNADFWNDTVLMYCALLENGFEEDDIYVVYGEGLDAYHDSWEECSSGDAVDCFYSRKGGYCNNPDRTKKIVDFPMYQWSELDPSQPLDSYSSFTCQEKGNGSNECLFSTCEEDPTGKWRCAPRTLIRCLATGCRHPEEADDLYCPTCSKKEIKALSKRDYLLVWWKSHGRKNTNLTYEFSIEKPGAQPLTAPVVSAWFDGVATPHRTLLFDTCKSGCLADPSLDYFAKPRRGGDSESDTGPIVLTSCGCDGATKKADDEVGGQGHMHGAWSLWLSANLKGALWNFVDPSQFEPNTPVQGSFSLGLSLEDAFQKTQSATIWHTTHLRPDGLTYEPPQIKDLADLAPHTCINIENAGINAVSRKQGALPGCH